MDYRLSIADLGVANDSTVIEADSPDELVEKVVDHLRDEHDINMPDADVIMAGSDTAGSIGAIGAGGVGGVGAGGAGGAVPVLGAVVGDATGGEMDPAADLLVRRLRELLNLRGPSELSG